MPVQERPPAPQALMTHGVTARVQTTDVFDDLSAEQDALDAVRAGLDQDAWHHDSNAAGWTVTDVVLHLAQTEEFMLG